MTPIDHRKDFPRTSLTLHQRIHSGCPTDSAEALNQFFKRYWLPLYGFLRIAGETHEDASDVLQAFIAHELLDRSQLRFWDPKKGSLRGFLKTCLDRFRKKERRRDRAFKRGGNRAESHQSIDLEWAEGYFKDQSLAGHSADRLFDREWAAAIVNQATSRLAEHYVKKNKEGEFRLLLQNLSERDDEATSVGYRKIAEHLETSVEAVKQRMRVFRAQFHQCLRQVVGEFVPKEKVDEEIALLLELLRGN
jgi:DNA-directed RNA polymerase specialized sigma24 family protein